MDLRSVMREGPLSLRPAETGDAGPLAARLRNTDVREISAATGERAREALERCIQISQPCFTATDRAGVPLAIFGIVPDEFRVGAAVIWMVGTKELRAHRVPFLRCSRRCVAELRAPVPRALELCRCPNLQSIRWLEWCGFRSVKLIERYGAEERPFWLLQLDGIEESLTKGR